MRKLQFLGLLAFFAGCVALLLWTLQTTGIYDVKGEAMPYMAKIPFVGSTAAEERLTPLDIQKRELERIKDAITEKERVMVNKELEMTDRERRLNEETEILEQRRRQIREIEIKLAERERMEDDRDRRLNRLVEIYTAMPPDVAAKQMETQDQDLTIEVLKRMKSEAVSIILSQMDRDRAGSIVLKMGKPSAVTQ